MRSLRAWPLAYLVVILIGCTSLGIPTPTSNAQRAEYARSTLNGVYDSVVILRNAGKLSDADKAAVMQSANGVDQVLRLVEGGNNSTSACLAAFQKVNPQAGIVTASSCLDLVTQVLTTLKANLGAKS